MDHKFFIKLYKNFTYTELPNYRLDTVAKTELNKGKIEYDGDLDDLFDISSQNSKENLSKNTRCIVTEFVLIVSYFLIKNSVALEELEKYSLVL